MQTAAEVVAKQTKCKNLVIFDTDGTSTDVPLIVDGKAALREETVVGQLIESTPFANVRTVGAGGGSVAHYVELTTGMRVGPESSGASPAPVCYRRGREKAMVF